MKHLCWTRAMFSHSVLRGGSALDSGNYLKNSQWNMWQYATSVNFCSVVWSRPSLIQPAFSSSSSSFWAPELGPWSVLALIIKFEWMLERHIQPVQKNHEYNLLLWVKQQHGGYTFPERHWWVSEFVDKMGLSTCLLCITFRWRAVSHVYFASFQVLVFTYIFPQAQFCWRGGPRFLICK